MEPFERHLANFIRAAPGGPERHLSELVPRGGVEGFGGWPGGEDSPVRGGEAGLRAFFESHPAFVVSERKRDGDGDDDDSDDDADGGGGGDDDSDDEDNGGGGGGSGEKTSGKPEVILGSRFHGVVSRAAALAHHKGGRARKDKDSKRVLAAIQKQARSAIAAKKLAVAASRGAVVPKGADGGDGDGGGGGGGRIWVSLSPAYLQAKAEAERGKRKA